MSLQPAVLDHDHKQGNPSAIIELVEYADFQCSFCGLACPIVKNIQKKFENELMFVFRHFPLSSIHAHAKLAAVAAEAAGRQGKFWEMHDMLYENQHELHLSALNAYAGYIGLNELQFYKDMEDEKLFEKVKLDFESGLRSGVTQTPTFFINGEKYNGSWDEFTFSFKIKQKIDQLNKSMI
jgi:protein-disulfide isomerase